MYSVDGFVDKNRDVQQEVFLELLSSSTKTMVQELTTVTVQESLQPSSCKMTSGMATVSRGTNKSKPTKSDAFRFQLQSLVDVLQSTTPW